MAKNSREILNRQRGPLPRVYRALDKAFVEGQLGPRQRKAAVTAPTLLAVSLPRAGPWQKNVFLKKIFAGSFFQALGKDIIF